jgi:flagella basal body P-ring formation protein FlgA
MNNGRPLPLRKQVQFLVALTILAWATQTLLAQWSKGAEVATPPEGSPSSSSSAFVQPREGAGDAPLRGGTLELRAEARVHGGEVRLKQVCRWSDADAAMFAPVADLVLARLEGRRPYKVIEVRELRETLEQAGINVALLRFAGPVECTVSRTDADVNGGEALEQWIAAREVGGDDAATAAAAATRPTAAAPQPAAASPEAAGGEEPVARRLRDLLAADLSARLSIPADQLVLSFDPRDEAALNLPDTQFKFNLAPRRARDLGDVAWDVTIVSPGAGGSRKVQLRGTARAWQDQVVAARPVARRQVLQAADVTARRTMISQLPDAAVLTAEQVVGQMAARDLKPGTVMTAPLVEAVPLAKTGQFITVTLTRGNVRIRGVAKALEGGSYGQTIRVKNESTKDVYQVVLTGPQEATMAREAAEAAPAEQEGGVAAAR